MAVLNVGWKRSEGEWLWRRRAGTLSTGKSAAWGTHCAAALSLDWTNAAILLQRACFAEDTATNEDGCTRCPAEAKVAVGATLPAMRCCGLRQYMSINLLEVLR